MSAFHLKADILSRALDVCCGSKADIRNAKRHVRFTPNSGHLQCTSACLLWAKSGHQTMLFDHLISLGEERWRHTKTKRLGGFEIDRQLELCGRFYRQVGRVLALEDTINVTCRTPV